MENRTGSITWGMVICKNCNEIIDMFESEKVTTYYGVCKPETCAKQTNSSAEKNEMEND